MFKIDSPLMNFLNRMADIMILNALFILCCLPVFTIGASLSAAYYICYKMIRNEDSYIVKGFFKSFKENFKQGTLMWLITAPCVYACYLIWQIVIKAEEINFLVILGAIIFTALVIVFNIYTYPMIARYENTLKNIIKNSLGISLIYFWKTVLLVLLVGLEIAIICWNRYTLVAGLLIGPEFIIYTISGIAKRIFRKIEAGDSSNSGTINQ